jgi:hypothetical protein
VRLEYLEDERVVLLHSFDADEVERLRAALLTLVDSQSAETRVEELSGVDAVGGVSLAVAVSDHDHGVEVRNRSSLRCALTAARWEDVVGLLEPFAEPVSGESGDFFQYLSEEGPVTWIISTSGEW